MGVKVWFPCGGISGSAVMPLVTVDEDLQCRDSPPLLAHLTKMLQLLQSGIILDYHDTLFERSAAAHDGHLPGLLVHTFTVFGLHRPTCLFLYHRGYLIVAVGQCRVFKFRCYPCLVSGHEFGTDVELFFIDTGEVFGFPPVVFLATSDVAGLDID